MGTTNFGTQTITFDYKQTGTAKGFNKLNYKLFPAGIYKGGLITRKNATTATIATLTLFIEDSAVGLGARIETASSIDITISEATPYIIARFIWSDVETNYMDFFVKASGDILTTDIILGKGNYIGGVLQSTFLYTERTISILTQSLGKFYYGDTDPTGTQRLNYDGYLYATRVYNNLWGDLAEYFPQYHNKQELPGRIYSNSYGNAILTCKKADKNILGVCSDTAGFILHEKYKENGVCIGLSGTIIVCVTNSKIKKGDFLVSNKYGYAKKATIFNKIFKPEAIIGKALENHIPNELCSDYEEKILMLIK